MKVRIKPVLFRYSFNTWYYIQYKKWWGYKTLAVKPSIKLALDYIEELKLITEVDLVNFK